MVTNETKASVLAIIFNFLLFCLKIVVGLLFNSISVISDAFNSLLDIISSGIIHISIKVSHKKPDKEHQFGHSRAQPIAGLIVAIFTAIFGFQLFIASIERMLNGEVLVLGNLPLIVMLIVMITKMGLLIYTKNILKKHKSLALQAACVDHKNDILISLVVIFGLFGANLGFPIYDAVAGAVVSIYIIFSGYVLAKENIQYVMGEAPPEKVFKNIEKQALSVKGVIGLNDIRAHMLGTDIECEVHIYVDKDLSLKKAHEIGNKVKSKIRELAGCSNVFIHIDPYLGKKVSDRKFWF